MGTGNKAESVDHCPEDQNFDVNRLKSSAGLKGIAQLSDHFMLVLHY